MEHRVIRMVAQRRAIALLGLRRPRELLQHAGQVSLRRGIAWCALYRLAQCDDGFLKPARLPQHKPDVVVQVRQFRLVPQRVAVGGERLLRASEIAQHVSHHLMRLA